MSAIDVHLEPRGWQRAMTYDDLALVVYGTETPSRAQSSSISRAVGRLVDEGRAYRVLSGRPVSGTVRREMLVYRAAPTEAELERIRRTYPQERWRQEVEDRARAARVASREALARSPVA